jgi:hypothetical protein
LNIQQAMGDISAEVKVQRDASGKINYEAWTKDVSPAGIILGNKRPMMPIEIMAFLCAALLALINIGLAAAPKAAQLDGGSDGEKQQPGPKAN